MDLESGAVVFVGEGRNSEARLPFRKCFKKTRTKIAAVATDMSAGYGSAVMKSLPEAANIFGNSRLLLKEGGQRPTMDSPKESRKPE